MNSERGSFKPAPDVLERESGELVAALWTAIVKIEGLATDEPNPDTRLAVSVRAGGGSNVIVETLGRSDEIDVAGRVGLREDLLAEAQAFADALNDLVRGIGGMRPHGGIKADEDREDPAL